MKEIKIGENLICLRHNKRITQEQLADFVGVTKASVSKWETGLSYPDIETLPRLAAFFDITLDQLMGYEPELGQEQVLELYGQLREEFAKQSFETGMEHSRELVKKYYHCYPLLLQVCILWLNHYYMAPQEEQSRVLRDVRDLAGRIRTETMDVELQNSAIVIRATAQILLKDADGVIEELEKVQVQFGSLQEIASLLIRAYQMKSDMDKARSKTQRTLYTALMQMVSNSVLYLDLTMEKEDAFEETVRHVTELMDIYSYEKLHPNNAAIFYYHAAIGYATMGKEPQTVKMLRKYWNAIRQLMLIDQIQLHGDDYFTEIGVWFEEVAAAAPREESLIKQSIVQSMDHPALKKLENNPEFRQIRQEMERYAESEEHMTDNK